MVIRKTRRSCGAGYSAEMNLEPSKLSKQANQVWSESARLFQKKKADPGSIDFGFSKFPSKSSDNGAQNEGGGSPPPASSGSSFASGYVFGARMAERAEKKETSEGNGQSSEIAPSTVSSIFERFKKPDSAGVSLWKSSAGPKPSGNGTEYAGDSTTAPSSSGSSAQLPSASESLKASIEELTRKQLSGQGDFETTEPVTTGEEGEKNLLNINCKFYHFNRDSKSWVERGLGTLRVNQKRGSNDVDDVRVIGRSSGNQKILINSKIWGDMFLEEVSEKRLKISAKNADSPIPSLFIVQANPTSISNLQSLLEKYIAAACVKLEGKSRKRKANQPRQGQDDGSGQNDKPTGDWDDEGDEGSWEGVGAKKPEVEHQEGGTASDC